MNPVKMLRTAFMRTTDFSRRLQNGNARALATFYRVWAPFYDWTVRLDPGYTRGLDRAVRAAVRSGDRTLDVGAGTGLCTFVAAPIARSVVSVDPSRHMLARLRREATRRGLSNVEIRGGFFPEILAPDERFESIVSSFMLAHLAPVKRSRAIRAMFTHLEPGGRLSLFSAQGEVASSFQTRHELIGNLDAAGFDDIRIEDLSDIYRIATAQRPSV